MVFSPARREGTKRPRLKFRQLRERKAEEEREREIFSSKMLARMPARGENGHRANDSPIVCVYLSHACANNDAEWCGGYQEATAVDVGEDRAALAFTFRYPIGKQIITRRRVICSLTYSDRYALWRERDPSF